MGKAQAGVGGFGDLRFWAAGLCYALSLPLFFTGVDGWGSFQIVMPCLIAFILVATLAWDYRLVGDPNESHCLILHVLFFVSTVFFLNRLMTISGFSLSGGAVSGIIGTVQESVALVRAVPYLGDAVGVVLSLFDMVTWLGEFFLKALGYAVILFLVSGALMFPQRTAVPLLFIFGLIMLIVAVSLNLNASLWTLAAGLFLQVFAFAVQRTERNSGHSGGDGGGGGGAPRINQFSVSLAEQLPVPARNFLAENRIGGENWRFTLSLAPEPIDFFTSVARMVRVILMTGFTILYILSPIDFPPDSVPFVGVMDDMLLGAFTLLSSIRTIREGVYSR